MENSGSLWLGLRFLSEEHRHLTRRIYYFAALRKFKIKLQKSSLLASSYTQKRFISSPHGFLIAVMGSNYTKSKTIS
jgi:hypothetical protein